MRTVRLPVWCAVALCGMVSIAGAAPRQGLLSESGSMQAVQRHLATPAGFSPHDFDLLVNYRTALPPAPSVVTTLLRAPARSDSLVPALRAVLRDSSPAGFVSAEGLWPWIDVPFSAIGTLAKSQKVNHTPITPDARTFDPGAFATMIRNAERSLHAFREPLLPDEQKYVADELPPLFRPNAEDTALNPIEREIERLRGDALTDSLLGLAARVPLTRLAQAARNLDAVLSLLVVMTREQSVEDVMRLLEAVRKQGVPVTIGTSGDDVHRLQRGLVFDPGGDDRYELPDSARPGAWLMVLDVTGNDTYAVPDSAGNAAAFLGAQLIADLAGDDVYKGRDFAFGSALMGFSRLYDAAGNDTYTARSASLGFAFHGVGILEDRAGHDLYSSAYLSQGASSTFGFGLLLDGAGDDRYVSRPEFLDDLRYRDRFLSLSQGYSSGFAPQAGGGIAVLWDRAGDDRYTADIFGQGAGYWFAWGVLMDDEGDDSLKAYQYAQGAGVHFAVGTLRDGAGDDVRVSKGVSQGCGHDGGFGLLADGTGNDRNTAVDMSVGAGSANGLGVLVDFSGDDTYAMGNPAMTLGHADIRRDRPSLGFFLDLGGRDVYPGINSEEFSDTKKPQQGGGVSTSVTLPGQAHENHLWRVYDSVKRGHGFGIDGEVAP
jgi:hypothetical protein